MQNLKSINIPQPCHQSWQQMMPVNDGRHCQTCCKTVTDFTKMTNDEIVTYLATNTNVCGRFEKKQINSINNELHVENIPTSRKLRNWAMAVTFLGSIASFKAMAQTGAPIPQALVADTLKIGCREPMILGKIAAPRYKHVSGQVFDKGDGTVIPGVTITVPGTNINIMTDAAGKFNLNLPMSARQLKISFIGYKAKLLDIDTNTLLNIKLYAEPMLLGEIVVTNYKKPSFIKRTYYKFIKRPIKKIFHS